MGDVVEIREARRAREKQQAQRIWAEEHADICAAIARGEGCPWSEEELAEDWSQYVRKAWRPRRNIKRGCIKRMMRVAYRGANSGTEWLKVCPYDLVRVAIPKSCGEQNVTAAAYLTMLLYDYLWRIAALSADDKAFAFSWVRASETVMLEQVRECGCLPESRGLTTVQPVPKTPA